MGGGDALRGHEAGQAITGMTTRLIPDDDPVSELLEDIRLQRSSYELLQQPQRSEPGWTTPTELTGLVVLTGELEVTCPDGRIERLVPSDFVLLTPRQRYGLRARADAPCPGGPCTIGRVTYCLDEGRGRLLFKLLPPALVVRSLQPHEIEWQRRLAELIADQGSRSTPAAAAINRRLVEAALIGVIQQFLTQDDALGRYPLLARIGPSLQAIHHAPDQPWTVASLAHLAGMSRTLFASAFAESTGETPARYLARFRLDRGRDMLVRSRLSLSAIAHRAGYGTDVAFARAFRRQFGLSPGRFRAERLRSGAPSWDPAKASPREPDR